MRKKTIDNNRWPMNIAQSYLEAFKSMECALLHKKNRAYRIKGTICSVSVHATTKPRR